ncbi:MAG: hypothetical protein IKF82_00105 [Bacilli bacterium]|nr:hypothetical protein [Bacilli bacterium]
MILEFHVGTNILQKNNPRINVDQNPNYYKCQFEIEETIWNTQPIYATFQTKDNIEKIELQKNNTIYTCLLPFNIASHEHFSLCISDDEKETNTILVVLNNYFKITKEKHHECNIATITLNDCNKIIEDKCNILSRIFHEIDDKIDNIVYEDFELKCYANDVLKNIIHFENIEEEQIQYFVNQFLQEFRDSFAPIAFSGSYNDLQNVPTTFNPTPHTHETNDITDHAYHVDMDLNTLLDFLSDEINKE